MTVTSTQNQVGHVGDGITKIFAIPFYFLEQSHISVVVQSPGGVISNLILNVDYTVSGAGNEAGGSLTFVNAPLALYTVDIIRNVPATQLMNYAPNDDFPATSHERALDKLTMLVQQSLSSFGRALIRPFGKNYYDAGNYQIKNLGDPTDEKDATNMGWVSTFVGSLIGAIQGPINNALNVLMLNVAGAAKVVQNIATGGSGEGDAMVAVKQASTNSVLISQHDINLQSVSIQMYGGKDDWNGTSGTNNATALANIISDFPNGCRIRAPKTVTGTGIYLLNSSSGSSDMSKFVLDTDPSVSFWHIGTNTPLIGPGLVVTRPVSIRRATYNDYFYLSPMSYGEVSGKPYSMSAGDGEAPIGERIITSASNTMQFKAVSFSTGAITDTAASTDGNTATIGNISGTGFSVGTVAIRPGQEVQANVTLPSNTGKICAYVETEGGWVIFAQDAVTPGVITRWVFLEGFPIQSVALGTPFGDNPAYNFNMSELSIKVHSPRSFSLLVNHVEISRMDDQNLTSDILRAGWGAGQVGNVNPVYISYPVRLRNNRTYGMRPLRVAIVGDSTSTFANPFSAFNHMRRNVAGVGGIQFKTILNQAIAGQTSLQQRDIVNATDYQALGGFDFMFVDLGINDSNTSAADYVQAHVDIINRCSTFNIIPIIALPAMYYNQADAAPYGQTGAGSAGADRIAVLRNQLARKLAELNVQIALLPMQNMGAALPSMLTNPNLNPVWQDNVHQSNFGGEVKGMGWAQALVGYLYARVRKDILFRTIKIGATGWIPAAQQATYGNLVQPAFGIRGDQFYLGNTMNMPAGVSGTPGPMVPPFGTQILQLPAAYAPENELYFNVPASPAGAPNGPFTLTVQIRILPGGAVFTQNSTVGAVYIHFGGIQWPLKS